MATTATEKTIVRPPKFSIENLGKNCKKLFGVSRSTFDGATVGLKGDHTVEEIKTKIDKWQKIKIKKEAK